jgi:dUTP pyrophosphatase
LKLAEPIVGVLRVRPDVDGGLPLPSYMTAGAAGMDVVAAIDEDVVLAPGARAAVPTGLAFALPPGFEMQVRARSGLALRHGVTVANAPGTVDSDYRGEVKVLLVNLGAESYTVQRGDRVAQLVVAPVVQASLRVELALESTSRADGGFGSTGD